METFTGKVTWAPIRGAYARIAIPQSDGIPLCVKATYPDTFGFRERLVKNTWVQMRRSPHDKRRYHITQILTEEEAVAVSKDRVRFHLAPHMLQKGKCGYSNVMERAFGLKRRSLSHDLICSGVTIICRPSQFARFMIYRNDAIQAGNIRGCNTFSEMNPELIEAEKPDIYSRLARATGVPREDVKKVTLALMYSPDDLEDHVDNVAANNGKSTVIDVSGNPAGC